METTRLRCGFGRSSLALFMVWREYWQDGNVVGGRVLFRLTAGWLFFIILMGVVCIPLVRNSIWVYETYYQEKSNG